MRPLLQSNTRNRLLSFLEPADFARLEPHLAPVQLRLRDVLIGENAEIDHVFFVESGIVSILAPGEDRHVEVGMIGPEGVAGLSVLLGTGRSPNVLMVQAEGKALRLPAEVLRAAFDERETMRLTLLRYLHCLILQTARTAYANARLGIEARLARWILMTQDRLGTDDLPLTHELLSMMLGTRRSSVTTATHILEGNGLIKARRAHIEVRNRRKLEDLAGDAYGPAEAEYERLFPRRG